MQNNTVETLIGAIVIAVATAFLFFAYTTTGSGSIVGANSSCDNDLPKWYNPATGATSTASASPGTAWYRFPFQRTYTIEQYGADLATRVVTPATYALKKVTVTVRATTGPFPGLRQTQQSVLVRYRDAG